MTNHNDLIERLRYWGEGEESDALFLEAADALAALVKERDDCVADRTKLRTLLDCKREDIEVLQARVKRLEDALREYGDHTADCTLDVSAYTDGPWPCNCGFEAALAEGDKP